MQWGADQPYVADLLRRRGDAHVGDLNEFVDKLRLQYPDRFVPYVAPTFGGVNARLLALFQEPGPKTVPANGGSGMLCIDNDDRTAARHKAFLAEYMIDICDVVSWNAYPWLSPDTGKNRSVEEELAATRALSRFLTMLPNLKVVMLHGHVARNAWRRLEEYTPVDTKYGPAILPGRVHTNRVRAIDSWHLSPRVVNPRFRTPEEIARFTHEIHESFAEAVAVLRGPSGAPWLTWDPDHPWSTPSMLESHEQLSDPWGDPPF
ncbi:Uracil-DNA glycosylase superfamily [Rhodococcus rhodochrous ATCC 21198]|uniref:uracil-DNA glycosylase n=1 Tax=Rhodococcus aetherivorans TaxID=191292 RepID=UPI0003E1E9FA|nr:uracil-DNA glycosylase [Rhodococcus aetherivorans]ETT24128.1 Uracil-DNA glycosylase superfamily [Rhodococcus rhodochrous ATCC 21198]NGP28906.1 uracil-DNA glycosylase [Rhodococcus aetherivorans]